VTLSLLAGPIWFNPDRSTWFFYSRAIDIPACPLSLSKPQADAISKHIDCVIGMRRKIKDEASIEFAQGFYDALGAGKSVPEAFDFGCNGILLKFPETPQHLIPVLKKKKR
jgi:hypothetical protein